MTAVNRSLLRLPRAALVASAISADQLRQTVFAVSRAAASPIARTVLAVSRAVALPIVRMVLAVPLAGLTACPAPRSPGAAAMAEQTIEVGRDGAVLSGVAGDGATIYAAFTLPVIPAAPRTPVAPDPPAPPASSPGPAGAVMPSPITTLEAIVPGRRAQPAWHTELAGAGGPLVVSGRAVVAALGGTGNAAGIALRGEPGAAVVALDAATGAVAWKLAIDATEWAVITALAAAGDGVLVGGSFSGTLRIGARVVSSAGKSDGFVARLTAAGSVAWLVRVGGPGADAIQGVAAAADRIAIAGTFVAGADLRGLRLPPYDERSPSADGFVAELDAAGAPRWAQSFGGKTDDAVAGVTIDGQGRVVVAASARDTVHVVGIDLVASGVADGLVAWWLPGGGGGTAVLVGGADFDGLRAIAPAGDHVVVGGFYSGALRLGSRALVAGGGDDAFLAELDASGAVVASWPVSGDGREEVTALAAIPGGFVAGISHTAAATIGSDALPAPHDPMSGAAVVVRAVR